MKRTILIAATLALFATTASAQSSVNALFYSSAVAQRSLMADTDPIIENYLEVRDRMTYPARALQQAEEGLIQVRVLVDMEGRYQSHEYPIAVHPAFQEEIDRHIAQLKFQPATKDQHPVMAWVTVPFWFKLTY